MQTDLIRNDVKLSELDFAKKQMEKRIQEAVFGNIETFEAYTKVEVVEVRIVWSTKTVEVKLNIY